MVREMGLLEKAKEKKHGSPSYICCPNCQGSMYPLEESINQIYVCESCGKTIDETDTKNQGLQEEERKLPIFQIFNDAFMQKYTNFDSFQDFMSHCPIDIDKMDASFDESIPLKYPRLWDKYVQEQTKFCSWNEMFEKAIEIHLHV